MKTCEEILASNPMPTHWCSMARACSLKPAGRFKAVTGPEAWN